MNRILVCTPIVTGVGPRAYFSHINLWHRIGSQGLFKASPMVIGPRRSARDIRNQAPKNAARLDASHVLFLDDDIIAPLELVDMLLEVDKPIVGGLINNNEGQPLVWREQELGEVTYEDHPIDEPFPCWAVALGAMLVQMDVFRKLQAPWFWFDKTARTMDVNFCRTANAAGIEVWCNPIAKCPQIIHDERWA